MIGEGRKWRKRENGKEGGHLEKEHRKSARVQSAGLSALQRVELEDLVQQLGDVGVFTPQAKQSGEGKRVLELAD
eukprot:CAMPEP_0113685780 /NCGR_PEP_ID=MMETSP0038_2-20120614/14885_1 /TAXON_ID=2898 /ORGANISM="Cryptomonas paramecium" /LENGTH=74 /DNA_ID=CAMNT_0000605951 /DNA_START=395 /DNA_END=620 /DNA_ORIENTATION=- /assembly_acc=CAM_ASM_000170